MFLRSLSTPLLSLCTVAALGLSLPASAETSERDRAVKLVNNAIEFYKKHGKEETFAEITKKNGSLRDGDLYLFVYEMDGTMRAHGQFAGSIGNNFMKSRDQDGSFYVRDRIEIMKTKDEAWQDYKYLDPKTKEFREKTSYLRKVENLYVFGCGVYK